MEVGISQLYIFLYKWAYLFSDIVVARPRPLSFSFDTFRVIHFLSFPNLHPIDTMYVDDGSWASRLALKDKAQVTVSDFVSIIKVCLVDCIVP